jgi:hypothetical protein
VGSDSGVDGSFSVGVDGSTNAPDGGTATDSGGTNDAGSSVPQMLDQSGQLAVLLEGSAANVTTETGNIITWKDLSKNHNDATTASGGPVLDKGALNGHDAVAFQSIHSVLTMKDAQSLQFATDEFFIVAVARQITGNGWMFSKAFYDKCTGSCIYENGLEFFINGTAVDAGGSGLTLDGRVIKGTESPYPAASIEDSAYHRLGFRRLSDGATFVYYLDDVPPGQGKNLGSDDVSLADAGIGVSIGGSPSSVFGNFPFGFDMAELIVVHAPAAAVSDQTVQDVMSYLKKKYAL